MNSNPPRPATVRPPLPVAAVQMVSADTVEPNLASAARLIAEAERYVIECKPGDTIDAQLLGVGQGLTIAVEMLDQEAEA